MTLEKLTEALGALLKTNEIKVVTAESCTGGGLAYWLTSISGSSDWLERGMVTYSNEAKISMLGVKPDTLAEHGAVSEAVAEEMAVGALQASEANISIAITGIAGPLGGSDDKPVGTVWFAIADEEGNLETCHALFKGTRAEVREQSIKKAMTLLMQLFE